MHDELPDPVEQVAGHLLKKQLLDPHWEKKAAEVMSLERATLYGLVIYSGRRVPSRAWPWLPIWVATLYFTAAWANSRDSQI